MQSILLSTGLLIASITSAQDLSTWQNRKAWMLDGFHYIPGLPTAVDGLPESSHVYFDFSAANALLNMSAELPHWNFGQVVTEAQKALIGESPTLKITSPVFDKVTIKFPSLNNPRKITKFEISTIKKNPDDLYIQQVSHYGKSWNSFKLPVSEFFQGGKLVSELGPEPNKNWGNN